MNQGTEKAVDVNLTTPADVIHGIRVWMQQATEDERRLVLLLLHCVLAQYQHKQPDYRGQLERVRVAWGVFNTSHNTSYIHKHFKEELSILLNDPVFK